MRKLAWRLWILTALFFARVVAQILVAFADARFLPPMAEWMSGLLPYPILLPVQIAMLILMFSINRNVWRERGYFTNYYPRMGRGLLIFSVFYVTAMVARYFISGAAHPERRFWPPGVIPIIFHFVLAAYVWTLGQLLRRDDAKAQ